jgi:hypothetical protein
MSETVYVVTAANKSEKYYEILKESCVKNGCELTTLGFGEKWGGFIWKYKQMKKFLKTVKSNDIVIFVDGFDVIMNEHIDVFLDKYEKFNKSIVLSVIYNSDTVEFFEKRIFGTVKYNKSDYWLCSGMYVGHAGDLIRMIDMMDIQTVNDDQVLLTRVVNNNPEFFDDNIALDTRMELFTNAARPTFKDYIQKNDKSLTISCYNNKILNSLGNPSVFVHGPGGVDLKPYLEKIGYTDIPDIDSYSAPQISHYLNLFIAGMFWYDWVIVFIVLIILILTIVMIIRVIRRKKSVSVKKANI